MNGLGFIHVMCPIVLNPCECDSFFFYIYIIIAFKNIYCLTIDLVPLIISSSYVLLVRFNMVTHLFI